VAVRRVAAGASLMDVALERSAGRMTIALATTSGPAPAVALAPAFPLDARLRSVKVDGAAINASLKNGVLTVTMPKAPESQPRQITVKVV